MKIIPAIFVESTQELQQEFDRLVKLSPAPKIVQVDIIDGEFAETMTIEPSDLRAVDTNGLLCDLHLMTMEPTDFLPDINGLKTVRRVIGQVERMNSISDFVSSVTEDLGLEAGLSLDIYTDFAEFESEVADFLDQVAVVQVMGNRAGEQGQELHPHALEKLREVAEYKARHGLNFEIAFDIGVNRETLPKILSHGATEAVVGSFLKGPDAQKHWQELLAQ